MSSRFAAKNIGFRRNIFRPWLDAVAALRVETADIATIRERLDPLVGTQIESPTNRRAAIDLLVNIWVKSADEFPAFHAAALRAFAHSATPDDRLWLHYGLTLLTYPFFRQGTTVIGQLSRSQDTVTTRMVEQRLSDEIGAMGALHNATTRIVFSLRDWGILMETEKRNVYAPRRRAIAATSSQLEAWLLAVALAAQPGEELTFPDLMRLPELFPFSFRITVDEVRLSPWFAVQRQGAGWDMVRLADGVTES